MVVRTLFLAALLVALQAQAPQPAPAMPFVKKGACPFEGCVYREWVAHTSVLAVSDPSSTWKDARPTSELKVLFDMKPGERVTAVTGVVVVTKAGRGSVQKAARTVADGGAPYDLVAGDSVVLLDYHGEGEWTGWVRGKLISWMEGDHGVLTERPESVWWVQLRNSRGQIGWTSQTGVFGNKDALGGPEPDYAAFSYDLPREPWTDLRPGVKIKPIVGETGTFVFAEMLPGSDTQLHHHTQEQGNFGLKGVFDNSMGGHVRQIRPGTGTLLPHDVQHFLANRSKDVVELLEFQPIRRLDLLQPRPAPTFKSAPTPAPISAERARLVDFSGPTKRIAGAQAGYSVIELAKSAGPANLRPRPVAAEQFFYVLEGEVQITVGPARQRLRAGQLLLVPRRATKATAVPVGPSARLLRFDPFKP